MSMEQKISKLFEYLLALRHLNYEPIKEVNEHPQHFYLDQVLSLLGCELVYNQERGLHHLEVSQQQFLTQDLVITPKVQQLCDCLNFNYESEKSSPLAVNEVKQLMAEKVRQLQSHLQTASTSIELDLIEQYITGQTTSNVTVATAQASLNQFMADEAWLEGYETFITQWNEWAVAQKQRRQTQALYNYLFHLMQDLKSEALPLEIMLGSGMLSYDDQPRIHYPILTTKLELSFDAQRGVALLIPSTKGVSLELEMLTRTKLANSDEILALRQQIKTKPLDLFDLSSHEQILKQFIHFMHPDGSFTHELSPSQPAQTPILCSRQVLFIQKKSDLLLKEDLRETIEYVEQGGKIPRTIQALLDAEVLTQTKEDLKEWDRLSEPLLFPLHANEEQRDIARRLANNLAVTVQGPPGTGKSHTIANLICHLLANGKRVLVTSEKDKALRVLMDKIPQEILPLCVSYLGGDRQSLHQIESSIRYISQGLAQYDQKVLEKEIHALNHQIEMVRRQMQLTKRNIVRFMELDAKAHPFENKMYQPYELAKLVADRYQHYRWFTDTIAMDATVPLSNEEFVRLWELKCCLPKGYEQLHMMTLPNLNELPRVDQFEARLNKREQLIKSYEKLGTKEPLSMRLLSKQKLEMLIQKVDDVTLSYEQIQRNELKLLFKQSIVSTAQYKKFEAVYESLHQLLYQLNECDLLLAESEVRCDFLKHPKFMTYVQFIRDKRQNQHLFSSVYLSLNKELKTFYETTRVNHHRLETVEDIQKLLVFEEKQTLIEQFKQTWMSQVGKFGLTEYDQAFDYNHLLKQFRFVLHTAEGILELNDLIKHQLMFSYEIGEQNLDELYTLQEQLKAAYYYQELVAFDEAYEASLTHYHVELMKHASHELGHELYEALVNQDRIQYATHYEQLKRLAQLKQEYVQFDDLLHRLKSTTPQLSQFIVSRLEKNEPLPGPFEDIFTYGKLNTFLTELSNYNVEELEDNLAYLEAEEKKIISQLIYKMTWYQLIKQITPQQDRALQMWVHNMTRLGKGTGRHAEALKKEGRQLMEKCQSAIPVWIMPTKEAIETFKIAPDLFDVVIVDESSQCNILSLPILMRAKKAVIVGDDQQISPVMPGISDAAVLELHQRYMKNVSELQTFDLQTSLYDIATQVFSSKGKLMLKEHFRSVPEIISFSNHLFYRDEMVPLKLPMSPKEQKQPVVAVYVPEGERDDKKVNVKEAQMIVAHIHEMIKDPAYDHHTMGVISLLGAEQARLIQTLLLEAIGEREMLARQLICGDAYSFQGDERDIMFLSLVVAPNMRYTALNKKMYRQRFNVSATRAKVQMRLYHSVTLEALSPEDLRYELLSYFQRPKPSFYFKSSTCKTKFEEDVKTALEAQGFAVYPNVSIGKHEIDLVIQSETQRIGLACDGDVFYGVEKIEQELERQRILKRCGWTFTRLRATDFYKNPTQALKPLITKLQSTR